MVQNRQPPRAKLCPEQRHKGQILSAKWLILSRGDETTVVIHLQSLGTWENVLTELTWSDLFLLSLYSPESKVGKEMKSVLRAVQPLGVN